VSAESSQKIISAGIDIGTTTTQLVISRLTIKNVAPGSAVPKMEIAEKEVLYRSDIHFTPLKSHEIIDAVAVVKIVEQEYKAAGFSPEDIDTGAVIITGETAKKENAKSIAESMAGLAGEFVVATAGVNLESILAGKGSGAAAFSKERHRITVNMDVGGGTTNIGVFKDGRAIDTACINIGGHLIEMEPESDKIKYIAEPARVVLRECGLSLMAGDRVDLQQLKVIGQVMARCAVETISTTELSDTAQELMMTPALRLDYPLECVMISGGVADFVYGNYLPISISGISRYGDIGPLLGWAMKEELSAAGIQPVKPGETIRATVIGAGTHSVSISGSTISVKECSLPLRNVTVVTPFMEDVPERSEEIGEKVDQAVKRVISDGSAQYVAVGLDGPRDSSFTAVQDLAQGLILGLKDYLSPGNPLIVVLGTDCAKVLGQSLQIMLGESAQVVCIDQIRVSEGDYIDIGTPLMGGRVVPVVVKTLVFEGPAQK